MRTIVPSPGCSPGYAFALCACGCGEIATILDDRHRRRTGYRRGHGATRMPRQSCGIEGCDRESRAKGLCNLHYQRSLHRHRAAALVRTDAQRFWEKTRRSHGRDCWGWLGAVAGGYGRFWLGPGRRFGRPVQAHRFAYELLVGPIPHGLTIDHLCCNKLCVNPAHMEPVTGAENTRRYLERVSVGAAPKGRLTNPKGVGPSDA